MFIFSQLPLLHNRRNTTSPPTTESSDTSRYLQLLCDSDPAVDADGYEVPLPLPPPHVQPLFYADADPPVAASLTNCAHAETYTHIFPRCSPPPVPSIVVAQNKCSEPPLSGRHSPTVTSALLKSPRSGSEEDLVEKYDPIETLKEMFTRGGGHGDLPVEGWSLSASSTAPCTPYTTSGEESVSGSHRNSGSGISSLSVASGMELDYMPKSSWC